MSIPLLLLSLVLAPPAAAQPAPTNTVYTWTAPGHDNWTHGSALTTLSNPGGHLNMQFAKQNVPYSVTDITWTDIEPGVLITNLSFRFRAVDIQPSAVRLYFQSKDSGNMWYITLPNPAKGAWVDYRTLMQFSAGWIMGVKNSETQFLLDIQSIDWVGIYVRRHGSPAAQNYEIDDFAIQAFRIPFISDTDGDGMPDAWESSNGLDMNDPRDADQDSDGDGMTDLDEYIAGTNPNSAASLLLLEPASSEQQAGFTGFVLRWNSVLGRSYSIWRSTDLKQGFSRFDFGIPGTPPENLYNDWTATNKVPYFYRLTVE